MDEPSEVLSRRGIVCSLLALGGGTIAGHIDLLALPGTHFGINASECHCKSFLIPLEKFLIWGVAPIFFL
jgi:hypothetical protein